MSGELQLFAVVVLAPRCQKRGWFKLFEGGERERPLDVMSSCMIEARVMTGHPHLSPCPLPLPACLLLLRRLGRNVDEGPGAYRMRHPPTKLDPAAITACLCPLRPGYYYLPISPLFPFFAVHHSPDSTAAGPQFHSTSPRSCTLSYCCICYGLSERVIDIGSGPGLVS